MSLFLALGLLMLAVLAYLIWREFSSSRRGTPAVSRKDAKRMLDERLFLPKRVGSGRKAAPISGKCYACSKTTPMPYKCKFCAGLYCDEHRLPEAHECEGLKRLKRDQEK